MNEEQAKQIIKLLKDIKDSLHWVILWTFLIFVSSCGPDTVRVIGGS
jgi:hypothetical protein